MREEQQNIKVGDTTVKIKTPPTGVTRPTLYCEECSQPFPSQLDFDEHRKIDHR